MCNIYQLIGFCIAYFIMCYVVWRQVDDDIKEDRKKLSENE